MYSSSVEYNRQYYRNNRIIVKECEDLEQLNDFLSHTSPSDVNGVECVYNTEKEKTIFYLIYHYR